MDLMVHSKDGVIRYQPFLSAKPASILKDLGGRFKTQKCKGSLHFGEKWIKTPSHLLSGEYRNRSQNSVSGEVLF